MSDPHPIQWPHLSSPVKGAVEQQLPINDAELQAGACVWDGGGEARGEGGRHLGANKTTSLMMHKLALGMCGGRGYTAGTLIGR